jgi:membrane protease YdiL (CAAX protease family)
MLPLLRIAVPLTLAFGVALALDLMSDARGVLPPGFRLFWRRGLATLAVTLLLAVGVFAPLGALGEKDAGPDPSAISTPQLFLLHALMVATIGIWFLLGYAGRGARPAPVPVPVAVEEPTAPLPAPLDDPLAPPAAFEPEPEPVYVPPPVVLPPPPRISLGRQLAAQLGFVPATTIPREIGLGLLLGVGAWVTVLLALMAVAGVLWAVGGESAVPKAPPALVPLIAGLPVWVRFLVSLSAGVVEESFFRGFLQPRVGILLSTACFTLAHLSYGQPFMLVGIALLSLIYGLLVRWRQNVWPAIAAHALFDGVQLLVIVPAALKMLQGTGGKLAAFLW